MVKIYTRKGDDGSTGLWYGGRVPKAHARPEAYGAVDEAGAARPERGREQADAVAVGARLLVRGERARLRAHQRDARVRGEFHYALKPAVQLLCRRHHLAAALGQPLVA